MERYKRLRKTLKNTFIGRKTKFLHEEYILENYHIKYLFQFINIDHRGLKIRMGNKQEYYYNVIIITIM